MKSKTKESKKLKYFSFSKEMVVKREREKAINQKSVSINFKTHNKTLVKISEQITLKHYPIIPLSNSEDFPYPCLEIKSHCYQRQKLKAKCEKNVQIHS